MCLSNAGSQPDHLGPFSEFITGTQHWNCWKRALSATTKNSLTSGNLNGSLVDELTRPVGYKMPDSK